MQHTLHAWHPCSQPPRLHHQRVPVLAGVSLKTQELYALVFVTRYLDLFTNYVSL